MRKLAIVTGFTGQDGSYLTEYLLDKGYRVFVGTRLSSSPLCHNIRVAHLLNHPNLFVLPLDLMDDSSICTFIDTIHEKCIPDMQIINNYIEVYNLAAQSHVGHSFKNPALTHQVNGVAPVRLLKRLLEVFQNRFRFYQASTSELYGNKATKSGTSLHEESGFDPTSPYAIAKHTAFMSIKNYREAYKVFAVNGILFNHESPRRGVEFVTRKITNYVANYATGKTQEPLYLGNLNAKRDWGDARDYVKAMYLMLQADKPKDYVVATGETRSVRDFCEIAFKKMGINIIWQGEGKNEVGLNDNNEVVVAVKEEFYRPSDVEFLLGDSSRIKEELKWNVEINFAEMVSDMVENDLDICRGRYVFS